MTFCQGLSISSHPQSWVHAAFGCTHCVFHRRAFICAHRADRRFACADRHPPNGVLHTVYCPCRFSGRTAGRSPSTCQLGPWRDLATDRSHRFANTNSAVQGRLQFPRPVDGEYWFAIRTANRNGQMRPEKISVPELRVAVDTRPPRLDLSAKRGPAGEIIVSWQSVDPALNAKSLQLQYQSTGNPRWQPIAIDSSAVDPRSTSLSSSATWWPVDASGIVTIRGEVTDAAGNAAVAQAQVDLQQIVPPRSFANDPRPLTASMNRSVMNRDHSANDSAESSMRKSTTVKSRSDNRSAFDSPTPTPRNGFAIGTQWPADTRTDLPLGHGTPVNRTATSAIKPEASDDQRFNNGSSGLPDSDVVRPIEGPALGPTSDGRIRPSGQSLDRQQPSDSGAPQMNPARAAVESPMYPPVGSQYVPTAGMPQPTLANRPAGTAGSRPSPPDSNALGSPLYFDRGGAGTVSAGDTSTPRGARASGFDYVLPPGERLRMVNSTTFELDYDVELVGRSGIAKVELWMTRDGGRTWQSIGLDNDNRSPFRTTVDGEGVYGYRMTVQSGNGLGGRPPQSGDLPEVWIGVDLTRPSARLISAEAGSGDREGRLLFATRQMMRCWPTSRLRCCAARSPAAHGPRLRRDWRIWANIAGASIVPCQTASISGSRPATKRGTLVLSRRPIRSLWSGFCHKDGCARFVRSPTPIAVLLQHRSRFAVTVRALSGSGFCSLAGEWLLGKP